MSSIRWSNGTRRHTMMSGRPVVFHCLELTPDTYLLTYTLVQDELA
jgi:hypothetical protein